MAIQNDLDFVPEVRENTSMSYARFVLLVTKGATSFRYIDNDPKRISRKWRKLIKHGYDVVGHDRLLNEEITFRSK